MPQTKYPKITITYCTQCKWLLRAAYFAQELLGTFPTLGEVGLRPGTGGIFVIEMHTSPVGGAEGVEGKEAEVDAGRVLWDRKVQGGFPEVKELKKAVRDVVQPGRGLGHVDGHVAREERKGGDREEAMGGEDKGECVECKS